MKTLDRYVIRELIVPFLIGTLAVVLMFQANLLIYLFKTFSLSSVPPAAILKLLLYKTPYFLNMTLPVGIALATSLALSRLTRESELTAIRSAGASILRVLWPVSLFGLAVGVGNYMLAEVVMPRSEQEATKLNTQLMILATAPDVKQNVMLHLGGYIAKFGTVSRAANGSLQVSDVLFIEDTGRQSEEVVYQAKEGTYKDGIWEFRNAILRSFKNNDLWQFQPKDLIINEKIQLNDIFAQQEPTEMTASQLRQSIERGRQEHIDTTSMEVSYHERFSVPAACYVFAVVGPIFAIWLGRSGGFVGVLLSILLVLVYYNVFIISTEIFGRNGWLSPWLSAWLPNVLFLGLAILSLRRLE